MNFIQEHIHVLSILNFLLLLLIYFCVSFDVSHLSKLCVFIKKACLAMFAWNNRRVRGKVIWNERF